MCFRSFSFLIFLFFSNNVISITLNIPDEVDERDLKYKNVVLKNKNIPAVSKRNPDPSKGPRIPVKEFKIQGVKSYPDLSISKSELDKIIETKRYSMMDEAFLQKSGYTIKELLELAETLNKIGANNDGDYVELPDIQKLIWLLKEQKNNRGLTIGEIEEIADAITTYYRSHGFFLAKAFVPKQDVRDGIVGLTVLEGVLGKVTVASNDLYSSEFLVGLFDDLKDKPVIYKNIEQKLYLLNDYPGLKVSGYFNPGDQIGDTHLNLNILKEDSSNTMLRIDNHGSKFTGKNRLYFQHQFNTPIGYGDQLTIGVMQTSTPDNSNYGSLSYRLPVINEKNYFYYAVSSNQYVIDPSGGSVITGQGLSGVTDVSKISYEYIITRTRKSSKNIRFDYQKSVSDVDSQEIQFFDKFNTIDAFIMSYYYDALSAAGKSLNNGRVLITLGDSLEVSQNTSNTDKSIQKINYSHSYLKFSHFPFTSQPVRYILKANAQYTDARLPPIEQVALGGPDHVRAFTVTDYSADSSVHVGMEMHFNYPKWMDFKLGNKLKFSNIANPYLFADLAYGTQVSEGANPDESAEFRGWGIGLEFKYKSHVTGHLLFAKPTYLKDSFQSSGIEKSDKIIFDMQYNF